MWFEEDGLFWFNLDIFICCLVDQGWVFDVVNVVVWNEGVCCLCEVMVDGSDFVFEIIFGGNIILCLLCDVCIIYEVEIWFCGLDSVVLYIEWVVVWVSVGGYDILYDKICVWFDFVCENLLDLLFYLVMLYVYDNSVFFDVQGRVELFLLLQMDCSGLYYLVLVIELLQMLDWVKLIVMCVMELYVVCD